MESYVDDLVTFCILIALLPGNFVFAKEVIYVSRISGNDSTTCGTRLSQCRTISYAIYRASDDSYIYLDGTATANDPYTCQSLDQEHPGIYLNKSISFVSINSRAYISCFHGNRWLVDGGKRKYGVWIGFLGLAFKNTSLCFVDASLNVTDSLFEDSYHVVMNFTVFKVGYFDLKVNNVVFQRNAVCMTMKSNGQSKLFIHITNSSFLDNGNASSSVSELPSIVWLINEKGRVYIQVKNCTFQKNTFKNHGMIRVDDIQGTATIELRQLKLEENGHNNTIIGAPNGIFYLVADKVMMSLDSAVAYNTVDALFMVFSNSTKTNVTNTLVDGFYSRDLGGGVFNIISHISVLLSITNSSFRNGKSVWSGGVVSIFAPQLSATIRNSTFYNISSGRLGGVMFVKPNKDRKDFVNELSIANCSFSDCTSVYGGAVYVDVANLIASITDCSFTRNSAEESGGALVFWTKSNATIRLHNVYFIENLANCNGIVSIGAPFNDSSFNFTTKNVHFIKNRLQQTQGDVHGILHILVFNKISFRIDLKHTYFTQNEGQHCSGILLNVLSSMAKVHFINLDTCVFNDNGLALGELFLVGEGTLVCKHSIFDSNGYLPCKMTTFGAELNNSKILFENSTFFNNTCGAIWLQINQNSYLQVKNSLFTHNGLIGAIGITIANNDEKANKANRYFANSKDNVLIQNTSFQKNTGLTGSALTIHNGKTTILSCAFVDNFVHLQESGQIKTFGSADIKVFHSVFKQTIQKVLLSERTEFVSSTFLHIHSSGQFLLHNTTVDSGTIVDRPLILILKATRVKIDNSSVTICPFGFDIKVSWYQYQNSHYHWVTAVDMSCKKCEYQFYSLQRGQAKGLYKNNSFKCTPCPRGAECLPPLIKSKSNFWGYRDSSHLPILAFTRCPFGYCKSPQSANSSKYNDCEGKRTGVMCGMCKNGYTEGLWLTHCVSIKDCNNYWFWIVFFLLVSLMASLLVFKPPIDTFSLKQVLWFKRLSRGTNLQRYDEVRPCSQENTPLSERLQHEKRNFSCLLEIIFYFYQIAHLLLSSYSLKEFFDSKFLLPVLGFFNFQPTLYKQGLCPFPGLTPKTKLVFKVAPVFGTMITIFTIYVFHLLICRFQGSLRPPVFLYLQASIKTLFLGYVTMATVSFSLIQCVSVAGENRWFYNGNVICYQWWQYASFFFNGIFVIPLIFVLAWASFKLQRNKMTVLQFLLAVIFPLPLLLFWLFRVVCPPEGVNVEESQNLTAIKEMLLGSYKRPDNNCKYGALYWQSVLIARRFVLVLIFCTFTEPIVRLFCMTLACVFVLFFHVRVKPFRNSFANNLDSLSLIFLIILGLINLSKSVFIGNEENIKGRLITVFKCFQWVEVVILGLFPTLLFIVVCLAIISLLLRALSICSRSLFKIIFRRWFQEGMPHESARLINVCEGMRDQ